MPECTCLMHMPNAFLNFPLTVYMGFAVTGICVYLCFGCAVL